MKVFLFILIILFCKILFSSELIIDSRGFFENKEIEMQNGTKLVHYESKGNWSDNQNNYGRFECKGMVLYHPFFQLCYVVPCFLF